MTEQEETVPSPLATGGAGVTFEHHVGAMFLALLLVRGIPAVFKNCQVEAVSLQTSYLGWKTDDLLIVCSTEKNEKRRLAVQVKLNFSVRASSQDCVETFQGFWEDFNTSGKFDPDKDALVLATLRGTNTLLEGLGGLLECARNSTDAEDFARRLAVPGFLSSKAKTCYQVIRSIVQELDASPIDEGEFWRFLGSSVGPGLHHFNSPARGYGQATPSSICWRI